MRSAILVLTSSLLSLSGCAAPYLETTEQVPDPPREMRAAWIATVHNIDWPSRPGLDRATQQRELLALLDLAKGAGLNTVVFQIRPACDALYASRLEPWSRYLTGTPGRSPGYDPLAFAVTEAHRRGLELHAWFNPYRASPGEDEPPPAPTHVTHPSSPLRGAVRTYGALKLLDPGLPEVQAHSRRVILDVVDRYDVDGVHMDDYFYPYPNKRPDGSTVPFQDDVSFKRFGAGLTRSAWRRANVDGFVRALGEAVHAREPWVKVGIAPFGIWRPKHPPSVRGMDAFEAISADSRRWLAEGWVDYLSPQLYWGTNFPEQRYGDLVRWWEAQNPLGRHLWPGIATRWIASKRDPTRDAQEIVTQIELARATVPAQRPGHCHWNLSALKEDRGGVLAALKAGPYRARALVPASPWLAASEPAPASLEAVEFEAGARGVEITWAPLPASARWVALQVDDGTGWRLVGVRRGGEGWRLPSQPAALALRTVSATGRLGPARVFRRAE